MSTVANHPALKPYKNKLISGFVDTYLQLNVQQEQVFKTTIGALKGSEREGIMQTVTRWIE
jgi:hypothetical protein